MIKKHKEKTLLLSFVTAAAMALTLFAALPTARAFAASQESYTFYYFNNDSDGNRYTLSIFGGTVKSASSSKSSVLTAKKSSGNNRIDISLKNTGKATVTVGLKDYRGRSAKKKYKISVKDGSTICSFARPALITGKCTKYATYAYVPVTNTSSCNFSTIKIAYDLKDSSGNSLSSGYGSISDLGPGQTGYLKIYYSASLAVDLDASTFSVETASQTKTGKNATKLSQKMYKSSVKKTDSGLAITVKNKSKKYLNIQNYVFLYDASGSLLDIGTVGIYASTGRTYTNNLISHLVGECSSYEVKTTGTAR